MRKLAELSSPFCASTSRATILKRPSPGAVPSGMSVSLHNLLRLGDVGGEPRWKEIAKTVIEAHYASALENPFAFSNLSCAIDLHLEGVTEIVLAGAASELSRAIAEVYLPNRVIARADGAPARLQPLVEGKTPLDGKPAAYVCRDFTCEKPTADPAALRDALT